MIIQAFAFYLFATIAAGSGIMVISSKNPVHSVLFLILAFFTSAGLFILLGAEFLAMILVVVYVGAVAVLFLFVVMMLDINFAELRQGFLNYLPIGAFVGVMLAELIVVVGGWRRSRVSLGGASRADGGSCPQHPGVGGLLYTHYIYLFQAAGIMLLIAMIGAIVLTHRRREGVRKQKISAQVGASSETDTVEVVKDVQARGSGRDGHWIGSLSDRRGHSVRHRRFRNLPQSEERDRHLDVDRTDAAVDQYQSGRLFILHERSGRSGLADLYP